MNEVFRRRLVGLAVLLVLLFVLSLLLPGAPTPEESLPSETISLKAPLPASQAGATSETPPVATDAPAAREPVAEVAISDVERPPSSSARVEPAARPEPAPPAPKNAELKLSPKVTPAPPKPAPAPPVTKPSPKPEATVAPKPRLAELVAKPPKPADKATPKPADKPAVSGWYVQVGSYSDAGKASTIVSLLQKIGYRAESSKIVNAQGKTLHRVRLGPYPSEAAAKAAQDKVARQGYPQTRLAQEGGR